MATRINQASLLNKHKPLDPTVAPVVDEFVALADELDRFNVKDKMARFEELKEQLHDATSKADPTQPVTVKGHMGEVEFAPCERQRRVTDKRRLVKYLSRKVFDEVATFTIKNLQRYLNETQIENVCSITYGSRKLKDIKQYQHSVH